MAGKVAQGTILSRENTPGGGSFTAIADVRSWNGPSTENPEIDTTSLSSSAKEFAPGLVDNGEMSLELNFDPNNSVHQLIRADMVASPPTTRGYRITFINPTINWTFNAFVRSFPISGEVDGVINGSLTLRITGPITIT